VTPKRGLVFDIQRYSVHDGPGIRTLVFLKGCPMRCLWCSNPEGQEQQPELAFRKSLCIACGQCVSACLQGALHLEGELPAIDREACDLCGRCADVCSPGALSLVGRWMTVEEVLAEVERDRVFYKQSKGDVLSESKGGITLSGGEPLAQTEFVRTLLQEAKARGLHTTMETSGHATWESLEKAMRWTDLLLYDLKHLDAETHRQLTGVSNDLVLDNLRRLARSGAPVVVRLPVVPGLNDSPDHVDAVSRLLSDLGLHELHLLPYHRLGEHKYAMLGRDYPLAGVLPPTRQDMERLADVARTHGLSVSVQA
jgi:pyruvate formate lyase activating enzyme